MFSLAVEVDADRRKFLFYLWKKSLEMVEMNKKGNIFDTIEPVLPVEERILYWLFTFCFIDLQVL